MSSLRNLYEKSNPGSSTGGRSGLKALYETSNPNGVEAPAPVPTPEPVAPTPKPNIFKRALSKTSDFLAGAAEAPTYTTGSKMEIAKNLPNEIVRTILPGAAAIADNPEEFAQISNKDIVKELPKATAQTGFDMFGKPLATPILTGYGATSKYINPKLGLPQAPGVGEGGGVTVKTPFGEIKNVQQRALETPLTDIDTPTKFAATAAKLTGVELLDWLYLASMTSKVVNPRVAPITPKQPAPIPLKEGKFTPTKGPQTGQLYEPQIINKPISPDNFKKIATEHNIPVKTSYNPSNPTFFQVSQIKNDGTVIGQFYQIKPSFLDRFVNFFKQDISKVPKTELIPVAQTTKAIGPVTPPGSAVSRVVPPVTPEVPKPVVPPTPKPTVPTETPKPVIPTETPTTPQVTPTSSIPPVDPTPTQVPPKPPAPVEISATENTLRNQLGDIFTVQEPVGDLWNSSGNTIFIRLNKDKGGFVQWLRDRNFIESAQEAGNNVYKVTLKNDAIKSPTPESIEIIPGEKVKEVEIAGKKVIPPEQLVTKTQVRDMLKGLDKDQVTFTVEDVTGVKYLVYKDAKHDIKLRPRALGLVEENITPGKSVTISTGKMKAPGTAFRGVGSTGSVLASSGSKPIDTFEKRIKEIPKTNPNFKLYEKVAELVKKYAARVGESYLPRGAKGVYYPQTETIRLQGMNNLSTAAHEVAHALDIPNRVSKQVMEVIGYTEKGNPIYDPATGKLRKELTAMYVNNYPGGSKDHKLEKRMIEGYATLLQKYVEQPTTTEQNYPNIVKEFLKPGGKYYMPVVGEMLEDLKDIVTDYQALEALDKVGARVTSDLNETGKESFLAPDEMIRTEVADEIYPIEKLARLGGVEMTSKDPSLWLRQYNNVTGLFSNNVQGTKGYWSLKNLKDGFQKELDYNWGDLIKQLEKKREMDSFAYFLVARDQFFNYKELDKLEQMMADIALAQVDKTHVPNTGGMSVKEVVEAHQDLKAQLQRNEFSREVITEAYETNKNRFVKEEEMFDALTKEDLKLLNNEAVGILSDADFQKLNKREGYASLKRKFYDEVVGDIAVRGDGISGAKPTSLKRRTGSTRTIINPVYNGIKNHAEILRKSMKQIVDNTIVDMAQKGVLPDLFQPTELKPVIDSKTGAVLYPQERDPNIIMGRKNGKRIPVLTDGYIKKTLGEITDFKNVALLERALRGVNRLFTKGTTGLYPAFTMTNFIIDQISAVANTRNNFIPVYSPLKEFSKIVSKQDSIEKDFYNEYMALGGERQTLVGWQNLSAKELAERIAKERTGLNKVIDYLDKGGDIISLPAKYSEIMTRASEYVKARKAGKPQVVALEEAGRVATPFHHMGRLGGSETLKTLVKSVPFFNPGLQVLEQAYRSSFKSGRKYSQRVLFTFLAVTAAQITALGVLLAGGNEEQKNAYKDLNPEELEKYMWLPNPSGKGLIKIRIPDQLNIAGTVINMAIMDMVADSRYTAGDYLSGATAFLPNQINPFKPKEALFGWIPQAVKPALQVSLNIKDFPKIMPLESQSQQRKEPGMRSTPATPLLIKKLGEQLNISPIKIDTLLTGYVGRASGFLTLKPGVYNPMSAFKKDYYFDGGRRLQNYYDMKEENDQKYRSLTQKLRPFTNEERIELLKERKTLTDITNLLELYRDVDEEKSPERAKSIRNKIITNLEKL